MTFEPVPVSSQKHDPAWRHCHMYKDGSRVQLKCMYCAKVFRGGGIHRIKEHLACQKGNASTCRSVPHEVRQAMQKSLDVVVVKKKTKQKLVDEVHDRANTSTISLPPSGDDDGFGSECGINNEEHLMPTPVSTLEPVAALMAPRAALTIKFPEKRKRGRPPKTEMALIGASDDGGPVGDIGNVAVNGTKTNSQVNLAIGRFLYDVGISLDAVNSVYFQPMLDAIALEGARIVGPSQLDLRGWILKSAVEEVKSDMDFCARAWGRTGCSILLEELRTGKDMTVVNFLVYCTEGTMFLKSVDVTNMMDATDSLFVLIKDVVDEVGVKNVLQLITPNEDCYAVVGKRLSETYPTVYWAPCAASSIMLILEDFGKFEWVNAILEQCKSITRFIYNHSVVLNMMRRYTFGVDLVVPDLSPSLTDFRTVKRMVELKHNLQALVTSQEWVDSYFSKSEGALAILDLLSDSSYTFWSSCNQVVHLTGPVLRVWNILTNEKKPAMGYVYAAVYRAKEAIKKEFRSREEYLTYWNVIDQRWEQNQQLPLYAAGFYLNPKFFYSIDGDIPGMLVSGMFDCIERLVPDTKIQDKIIKELNSYKVTAGDFGRKMAVRARDSLLPSEWWSTYGGGCPNLSRLAVRVLGQCCSLTRCKQDLVLLEQMHTAANSLERERLSDQVFTQYNLRLRQLSQKDNEHDNVDPLSVCNHPSVVDWIAKKNLCLEDTGSSDWTAIELPSLNKMRIKSSVDEFEELGRGFDDYEIFGGIKDEETSAD